jgi:hypothetical protein
MQRVELSSSLLRMLEGQEQRAWHDIVTLDESWFYSSIDHESIWLQPGEKVPERTHVPVQCKKWIITIVWNSAGFQVIRVLPKGCKFTSSYYPSEILEPLSEWRSGQADAAGGTLIVHADNARPHSGRGSGITAIHGGERDGKSPSPTLTLLAGLGTL